jgi:hypothetical protein
MVSTGVSRGIHGNGTHSAGLGVIGGAIVDLCIRAKFELHGFVVGFVHASSWTRTRGRRW